MRLSDIIKNLRGIFEFKRKNPIHLRNDSNLESNLKPLKVANKNTPIQISEDTVDVKGSLKVNGVDVSTEPDDDTDTGATELNELSDVTYSSGDLTIDSLDKIIADDFEVDSAAGITLDSHSGNFIAKKGGTQFSATNSAYAGMILGYTCIGLNEARGSYNLTTSYAVPTDEFSVSFKAPPSGKVEIFIQFTWSAGSSNAGDCFAGLSTANATSGYSATNSYDEKEIFDAMSRGAYRTLTHRWTITGLTAGASYQRWVGFKSSSTTGTPQILYGGNASGKYPNFIMKATALPETITT